MEAFRQHVGQEAANELRRGERHGFVAAWPLDAVVLEREGHAFLIGRDEPPVGDGDAVGVAGKIGLMCTSSNGELTRLLLHFPVHRSAFTLHYEACRSNASSLSVGWNAPRRRCGGTIASIASSFSVGSPRV